jgi:phosphoenolpyruvate synthase/pyruvate phosphate dikinase
MTILWLDDEDCHEVQRVGGKAANLSRLASGYRVPTCTNSGWRTHSRKPDSLSH